MTRTFAAFAVAATLIASPGYAYLDGATASIALQALVGFFAAWGLYSRRATSWVKGLFKKEPATPAE